MARARLVALTSSLAAVACGAVPGAPLASDDSQPLQPLVDAAPAGGILYVPAGRWAGPVVVTKPLVIDGAGGATVTGNGHGTVITVQAPGVVLRGLHLTGSGSSHDAMDSAVLVEADDVRIEANVIGDSLFGVFVKAARQVTVCGNRITSKLEEPSLRGDGVRVWNGGANRIVGNDVHAARDVSLANTRDNVVHGNSIRNGRYGLQLVFAPHNAIEDNVLDGNLTGIAVLYSNDVTVRRNLVQHSRGVSGAGLAFKESGQAIVEDNDVIHCAVGAKTNAPTSPEAIITFRRNRFAHNVAGMDFYGENGGHLVHDNRFERNLVQVTTSGSMSARLNDWKGNAWDDYEGFDRDGDGIGDTPYDVYAFADRIWQEEPQASFFRNAPALELLDFLERLAPFASPELTLSDPRPRMARSDEPRVPSPFTPTCPLP
ncbi:MAG: nitrous oxide reductase family maturation protein NosD [Myxococcaceae bacterium]|jgi:nitrous oxidase accessory protein|nr:nitrous oxide reductase family maturation protein NosD [Myxococcaceae bacterium]